MSPCPSIETLFEALDSGEGEALTHAERCPACAAVLEEHRQLEKDLYRLADPLPPSDLVMHVMAKVRAAPAPRRDLHSGLAILFAACSLAVVSFVLGHGHPGSVGSSVAQSVVSWHGFLVGMSSAVGTLWRTMAVPFAAFLALMLFGSLFGLRKLAGQGLHSDSLVKVS